MEDKAVRTIRTKIILAIVVCSVITAVIIGGLSIINARNSEEAVALEEMGSVGRLKSQEMNDTIQRVEQSVDTLSDLVLKSFDVGKFKQDKSYADDFTASVTEVTDNFAMHTEGAITCYIRYNPDFSNPASGIFLTRNSLDEEFDSVTPTDFSMYDENDAAHVGWYYIPVKNGAPIWMDPYMNENIRVYMISYVVPLFAGDGTSIGIVGMDIDFGQITDQVDALTAFSSGYAFLTSEDGTIIHNKKVEAGQNLTALDKSLSGIGGVLSDEGRAGRNVKYSYQGKKKQLCYYNLKNGMKLILTVPEGEIFASSMHIQLLICLTSLIAVLLAVAVGVAVGMSISRPLQQLTQIIKQTAQLDFKPTKNGSGLRRMKDEVGVIANEVHLMRKSLRDIVGNINQAELNILQNVDDLNLLMQENSSRSEDNSAATQELAASMQLATTNVANIVEGIAEIKKNSGLISQLAKDGKQDSQEVFIRASEMEKKSQASSSKTNGIYEVMKQKSDLAITQSKAVDRINELTDDIKKISSQTNLLALNASIEAARAGDAGRGFAVVATEIGDLAGQTLQTVENINSIVGEVNQAVANMTECITGMMTFLEDTVLPDYKVFMESGGRYQEDAEAFNRVMNQVGDAVDMLDSYVGSISDAVQDISGMVNESSDGITVIAQKSTETAQNSQEGYQTLQESRASIDALKEIVKKFRLQ